jgi:formylmethanofuran dehydrogenase subunit E
METSNNLDFDTCVAAAKAFHGDLCTGVVLGTRMAILGLNAVSIEDPKGADRKNLIVYVETDRCVSDAILAVTGCHPGKRTMKILDYGKMAATFINLKTGKAVRVNVKPKDNDKKQTRGDIEQNPPADVYAKMPAENLFNVVEVSVNLKPEDMPGKPLRRVTCEACGEQVMDMREEEQTDGKLLCRPCAVGKNYYSDK